MKTRCRCCHEETSDMAKKFDHDVGYVCFECWTFLAIAESALHAEGIRGAVEEIPDPEKL